MAEIKIEKGIPLPEKAVRPPRYPFASMEIGDSFVRVGKLKTFYPTLTKANKAHAPKRFVGRQIDGEKMRVWRAPDAETSGAESKPEGGETLG